MQETMALVTSVHLFQRWPSEEDGPALTSIRAQRQTDIKHLRSLLDVPQPPAPAPLLLAQRPNATNDI